MEMYEIVRVAGAPDWKNIPALQVDHYQWQESMDVRMRAQICHDGERLHIYMRAWEGEIRAVHTGDTDMVCEDSCMEFFLRPMENDLRYFNFEINPNASMFIGFGSGKESFVRLLPERTVLNPVAARVAGGWTAGFTIPFSFIRNFFPDFQPEPGKLLRANCYKCAQKAKNSHFITWNPVNSPVPSFHRPSDFGAMYLK